MRAASRRSNLRVMPAAFDRLAPFLREFVWNAGWPALRPLQEAAVEAVLDTGDDLLISAATASGKTEAAFLPILSAIHADPKRSVQAVYVGPLKALINNQFERLEDLCRQAEIPVVRWHGDAGDAGKSRVVEEPRGVLQITPESIESLLLNRTRFLRAMFADLQFVVIDELHTFLDSDRGLQLRSQLERLRAYTKERPRRVGLSATLGDPAAAQRWLNPDPARVRVLTAPPGAQAVKYAIEHFEDRTELAKDLFALTRNQKTLIFCNARAEVEELSWRLNDLAKAEGLEERYLPHHGSVAKSVREDAEARMKEADRPSSVVCTSTLELGIDVGRIDLVAQVDATSSVASMVQRLGRSGRRAGQSQGMMVYTTEAETWQDLPFSLLQAVAVTELWRAKWCEPVAARRKPFHVLAQQMLSLATERNGLKAIDLVRHFAAGETFASIEPGEYELLLRHLVKGDLLQQMADGTLLPGLAGEKAVRAHDFYAVFSSPPDVDVRAGDRTIGRIGARLKPGVCFLLAGQVWRVDQMFQDEVLVSPAAAGERPQFGGVGGPDVHPRVAEKAREILCGAESYPYLSQKAAKRLAAARARAAELGIGRRILFEQGVLVPWLGSRVIETLAELFAWAGRDVEATKPPWILDLKGDVAAAARKILASPPSPADLSARRERETLAKFKFDEFLPDELLRIRHASDELAMDPAMKVLGQL